MSSIEINGLPLPPDLLRLIDERRWKLPSDVTRLWELTAVQRPEDFTFMSKEGMRRETAGTEWLKGRSEHVSTSPAPSTPRES